MQRRRIAWLRWPGDASPSRTRPSEDGRFTSSMREQRSHQTSPPSSSSRSTGSVRPHPAMARPAVAAHVPKDAESAQQRFEARYAMLFSQLFIAPHTIEVSAVRELTVEANRGWRGLSAHLKLAHAIRTDKRTVALDDARRWARSLSGSHPVLAARMFREIALADLDTKQRCSHKCEPERPQPRATRGRSPRRRHHHRHRHDSPHPPEAAHAARDRCRDHLRSPGLRRASARGDRAVRCDGYPVSAGLAEPWCGRVLDQRRDRCTPYRRAENGDRESGHCRTTAAHSRRRQRLRQSGGFRHAWPRSAETRRCTLLLDEAITAAQGLGDADLLGEAWSVALDLATQTGDIMAARRALLVTERQRLVTPRPLPRCPRPMAVGARQARRRGLVHGRTAPRLRRCVCRRGARAPPPPQRQDRCSRRRSARREEECPTLRGPTSVSSPSSSSVQRGAFPIAPTSRWSSRRATAAGRTSTSALCTSTPFDDADVARTSTAIRRLRARAVDLNHKMYEALANPRRW